MKRLDLNLLTVLITLLEVKNTRKASELLHTSQPAVSRSLTRLRTYFNDDLFIRSPHGLEPTAKALEIGLKLPKAMELLIESVAEGVEFKPVDYQGKITIALNGFIANWLPPSLSKRIFAQAPQVELNIIHWEKETPRKILDGEIQLGVNYYPIEYSKQLLQMKLGEDDFVIVCCKDHPITERIINRQHLETYPMASIIISNWNADKPFIIEYAEKLGIKVKIKFRSNWINLILNTISGSDLLLPCSKQLARSLSSDFKTLYLDRNLNFPVGEFGLFYSNKTKLHPLNEWLKSCLIDCVNDVLKSQ